MKKLFISQPMNGLSKSDILSKRAHLLKVAKYTLSEDLDLLDSYVPDEDISNDTNPLYLLSRSLEKLSQADVVIFSKGWVDSRGCRIEYDCAIAYKVPIILLEDTCESYLVC